MTEPTSEHRAAAELLVREDERFAGVAQTNTTPELIDVLAEWKADLETEPRTLVDNTLTDQLWHAALQGSANGARS